MTRPSRRTLLLASLATCLVSAGPSWAAGNPQAVIDRATAVIVSMTSDQGFGNAPDLLRRAKAVMIVPQLVKGGFVFGGEGGEGVLLRRDRDGWSEPAFYTIGAASFGLQIGLEEAELVMFVMSDRALDAWVHGKFKLGADAGLTVLVVGANGEAATTGGGVDVIAWARSKGAYAGLTLSGAVIEPRHGDDSAYYGHPYTTTQIVLDNQAPHNPGTDALRRALTYASGRPVR